MNAQARKLSIPLLIVLAVSTALFFTALGDRPLRNPDEGRYAEIAREMVETGDWVVPRLYGVDYLRKPVLFYWLTAASFSAFGFSEWAARLVPALFGWAGVLLIFFFVRSQRGESAAVYSALILATNVIYLQISRYLIIDAVFALLIVGAILALYRARYLACFALTAAAFLAKGPVAPALVGVTAFVFFGWERRLLDTLKNVDWFKGIPLFLAIVLPWFLLAENREPGFIRHFFIHENLSRYTASGYEHQEPWWFYLALMPLILLPWSLYVKVYGGRPDRLGRLCWSALAAIVVFYSCSRSKLLTYLMPAIPFAAMLIGGGWAQWDASGMRRKARVLTGVLSALLAIGGAVALFAAPVFFARSVDKFGPEVLGGIRSLAMLGVIAGVAMLRSLRRPSSLRVAAIWIVTLTAAGFAVPYVMRTANAPYTTRQYADALRPMLRAGDAVYIFDDPGAFYDFRFYLAHPVRLVGLEGELELSRSRTPEGGAWVSREAFMRMLRERAPLYALMRKSDYLDLGEYIRAGLHPVQQQGRKVLFRSGDGS